MCEQPSTGMEHVPARSLFPKEDACRKNLIRVPSCDQHNTLKSKDDEYLRAILAVMPDVNEIGLRILETKVISGLERRPHHIETFYDGLRPVVTPSGETAIFTVARERFDEAIGKIVRGLFFHEYRTKLFDPLYVICNAFRDKDSGRDPFEGILADGEKTFTAPWSGANPEIFSYSFQFARKLPDQFICRIRFFEGCLIYSRNRRY